MERRSQVLTADVEFEGEMHSASYYVEHDIIHAHIGGRLMAMPKGDVPAGAGNAAGPLTAAAAQSPAADQLD